VAVAVVVMIIGLVFPAVLVVVVVVEAPTMAVAQVLLVKATMVAKVLEPMAHPAVVGAVKVLLGLMVQVMAGARVVTV
jgi:hypothetical protein